jgi:FkbM family methyltransferase
MVFISYAQNFEDVILWRAFKELGTGFYVDVGAAHPDSDSVTRAFYDLGWHGINVEPSSEYYPRLVKARSRDVNLNVAIGEDAGCVTFFQIDGTGLSTVDPDVARLHRTDGWEITERRVARLTLAEVCRRHAPATIHFLKIDVEGSERIVLAGADLVAFRPWVILVEATRPMTQEQNHAEWEHFLLDASYRFAYFDGLNRFYVAEEHFNRLAACFRLPPNTFDDFLRVADTEIARRMGRVRSEAAELVSAERERVAKLVSEANINAAEQIAKERLRAIELVAPERARARKAELSAAAVSARLDAQMAAHALQLGELRRQSQALGHRLETMYGSASWRTTAPLRAAKLLLSGRVGLALVEAGMSPDRAQRLARVAGHNGGPVKRAGRAVFYVMARGLFRLPGAAAVASALNRRSPITWRWLRRYNDAFLASASSPQARPKGPWAPTPRVARAYPGPIQSPQAAVARRTRKVHQFHSGSSTGDAITNAMLRTRAWLRDHGYESEIYVEHRHPDLLQELLHIDDLPLHGDYVLIVRHSAGYDPFDRIMDLPAPKVLIYHNITPPELLADNPYAIPYAQLGRRQLALMQPHMISVLADSEYSSIELRSLGFDSPEACPLLFDVDAMIARAGLSGVGPEPAVFTVLFVGRMVASKGQADLVDAFAVFREAFGQPCRLVLVGHTGEQDAEYPAEIARRVVSHGLGADVIVTGSVSDEQLHAWYRAADLYVSLSLHEGFGVPLVEAMAYGIPVIAWPCGAVPFTLGGAGILLADRSPEVTAEAMLKVATDASRRADIVTRYATILQGFRLKYHFPKLVQAIVAAGAAPLRDEAEGALLAANLWITVAGHTFGTYSLAIVNRTMALAFEGRNPGKTRIVTSETIPQADSSLAQRDSARTVADLCRRPRPPTGPEVIISQNYPILVPEEVGDAAIAFLFWEESLLPVATVAALGEKFDAVFAPTRFVAKVLIDSGVPVPVRTVGYVPALEPFFQLGEAPREGRRAGKFSFLHVSSCFPRKGVDVLLAAYAREFRRSDPVRLVIKGFPNPHNDVAEQIDRLCQSDPEVAEIVLINEDIGDAALLDLYRDADAMVLPTRGEGFNIPAAEAMAASIPLIVTGHGGHLDFCTAREARFVDFRFAPSSSHLASTGSVWVEPEVADLAAALREVFCGVTSDGDSWTARAAQARAGLRLRLDPAAWTDHLVASVVDVLTAPPAPPLRIAWVSTWDVACGVAEYSRALLQGMERAMDGRTATPVVLCDQRTTAIDGPGAMPARPVWQVGEPETIGTLARTIANEDPDVVVIQHQPGLIGWQALADLLTDRRVNGRITVVTTHAARRLLDVSEEERTAAIAAMATASRVLVHCAADMDLFRGLGLMENVALFPQGAWPVSRKPPVRALCRTDAVVVSCYGFFLPGKGIPRLIKAVGRLRETWPRLRLRLVNAEYPSVLSVAEIAACRDLAGSLGLADVVEWYTEFSPNDISVRLLAECDLVVLPYDHSKESSSAALRGAMASGVPIAVTPIAIFDEADDAVYRFTEMDPDSIAAGMDALLLDLPARVQLQDTASLWMAERGWDVLGRRMLGMLHGLREAAIPQRHASNTLQARKVAS